VIAVAAGHVHSCAIVSAGAVKCWGGNWRGQLGDGTFTNSHNPVNVSGITGAIKIDAGEFHTCVVISGGEVKCWGSNYFGEIGNGEAGYSPIPVDVVGLQ